jgi:hypothetical protein
MAAKTVTSNMEQNVASKMMNGDYETSAEDVAADAGEYPGIEIEIKVCGSTWDELRKKLPLLFK